MPTYRDSGDDFVKNCGFDFNRVNVALQNTNRLLILKMHPDSKLEFSKDYSNIKIIPKTIDIYPVLPFTNCLITDYSSIYFDYILMKDKQVILFIPDYDEYINNSRDLAFPYDEYTKGIKARTFEELFSLLEKKSSDYEMPPIDSIRNEFWNPTYKDLNQLVKVLNERI